jgi:hypothetical protein
MAELFDSRYFSGQGKVFIGLRDASGNPTGLTFIGDIASAELQPNVDKVTVIENVSGIGGIGAEFIKKVEYSFSMQMRSIKPEHFAQALHASNTTKAAGSVVDEIHKAYAGKFISLAHTKVSTIVVKNSAGSTTYTAGTDYVAHNDLGMVEILPAGGIADASTVKISYNYAAQHHLSAAPNNNDLTLVFAGINRADNNKQTRCELYKLKLSPSALGFIADGAQEMPITGTVLLDSQRQAGDQFFSWKTED